MTNFMTFIKDEDGGATALAADVGADLTAQVTE